MAEKDFNGGEIPGNQAIPPAPKPRKKRRLVLKIIGVVVFALILLVLAAPTLLSTGPVVSGILAQVNKQLNGKVEVASLSLGWFTGVKVDGVRVTDASGTQIAGIDHAAVGYPLWKALTGKFALGEIPLDGVSFDAKLDANHQLNFAQLVKPSSTTPSPANTTTLGSESKPSKLPAISANLTLTNCHGTFSQPGKPTVYLTKLDGEIKIPGINQPITDQINAAVKLGDQQEGTIALNGSAAVINANQIAIDSAEVHQTITVQALDLKTVKPFIPDSVGVTTLDGSLGIRIALDLTGGKNAAVDAAITATKPIAFGGKVLQGDTFTTNSFEADIPKLTAVFPDGLNKWQSGRIKVGADAGSSPILLKLDQGQVTVLADLMPQAILNLIDKKKPDSVGQLVLTSSFDLAKIIPQLKNTIHQPPGVSIQAAGFSEKLTVALSGEKAVVSNTFDSTKVTGTQSAEGAASKFIAIDPIHLSVTAADLGGGGDLPNLRDMNLTIQSKFANGEFKGDSLSDLNGLLKADLNVLREELAQFVDLKGKSFGGNVEIKIIDHGQLTAAPDYKADVQVNVTANNLQYADAAHPQINEPMVQLNVSADLQGSAQAALQTVRNISLSLKTGDMNAPTVDLLAEVPGMTLVPAPAGLNTPSSGYILADAPAAFKLTHFTADLAKLQKELAGVPAGTAGVVVNQGVVSITSAGTFRPHGMSIDSLAMNADHLFVAKQLGDGKQINAVAGEGLNLNLAATVNLVPTADKKAFDMNARVKTLTLADTASILDIHKDGDGELALARTAIGGMSGAGQLALSVQLGSINEIRKILGQTEVVVKTTAGDIRSGKLSGTVTIAAAAQNKTGVNADLKLDDMVVTTATGTLPAQSATVNLKATADQAISNIAVEQAGVKSTLANATITGATISLSSASVFDKVQSAHWQVDVPDLKPVMDLANAFSPPPPAPPADKSIPPLEITSGAVSLSGDLSHDHSTVKIKVNDVSAKNVAFTHGQIHYAAKPVDVKLLAAIQTGDGKTVMDQIRQVQITQLTGNLGIVTLSMPTPISISQLSSNPIATGGVQLVGNLTDLTQLLSALQGQKPDAYPYRGEYTLTENIDTQKNTITLKGGMQIAKFQSYNGDAVTFSEDLVNVGNDLSVTTIGEDESVKITSFTAAMQSSGAANVSLKNGSLAHLQTTRDMLLQLNVNYDLAKLWPIVQPMMGDKYKTLKIAGQFQKQFNVSGRYPADVPSTVAIKTLHADGDVAVASFDYNGLNLQNFIVPFTLSNGQLVTVYANKPAGQNTAAPAVANSGTLDLSNLSIDLTQDPPRLTTPPKKVLVSQMTINPLFAGTILKSVINNPLFSGKGATGLIDLTVDDCTNLPLGDLVMQQSPANTGKTDMHFSMTKLNIGLASDALQGILKQQSFEADVKDATISIAKGICVEHINFSTGSYVLAFDGNVRLKDQALMPLTLGFPLAIIAAKTHLADANTVQFLPDQLKVPVEGTVSNPNYRFDKVLPKALADAAAKALANGLLGGGTKNNNNNGAGNGGNGNADPLGGLLKGLEKKKHN